MNRLNLTRRTAFAAALGSISLALTGPPAGGGLSESAQFSGPAVVDFEGDRSDRAIGKWRVTRLHTGTFRLSWSSPVALPVTNARPEMYLGGRLVGVPEPQLDGRTLTLDISSPVRPRVAKLSLRLSGRTLDEVTAQRTQPPAAAYRPQPGRAPLAFDPGVAGTRGFVTDDYRLPSVRIPGLPSEVEMVGHVVRPADGDRQDPLVVFLHGKHSTCYDPEDPANSGDGTWPCSDGTRPVPSQLGYDYLQRLLASQGYVTVSIAANGINAQDFLPDSGAQARAALLRQHLDKWTQWDRSGKYVVDMSNVVLVGHSRGGEGVKQAAAVIPLSAPYRVTGLVLIAPTSFTRQVAAYVPTVTLLPYCDGDVIASEGQTYTDLGRDLARDDTAFRSSVMILGANHNFFNTEWTPGLSAAPSSDDWGGDPEATCGKRTPMRLSALQQRRVSKAYVAGAVHLFAGRHQALLRMFDGSRVSVASAGDADVRTHAVNGGRTMLRPGTDIRLGAANGATTLICAGFAKPGLILAKAAAPNCGRGISSVRTPHWPSRQLAGLPASPAVEMSWTAGDQFGRLKMTNPVDLSNSRKIDLRTVVDTAIGDVRLKVRLRDANGVRTPLLTPAGGSLLPALPAGPYSLGKRWAQTLRVPLAEVSGVDLSRIVAIDLVGKSNDGRVWVLDVAAVDDGLAVVPTKRLPRISIDDVRTVEGDGPGQREMSIPFSITGDVSEPSRVVVLSQNLMTSTQLEPLVARIPAGQRTGVLSVAYTPDDRDDVEVQQFEFRVYGLRGIVTRGFTSLGRLVDDDPDPDVTFSRVRPRITEGRVARWQIALSTPVDYAIRVQGRVIAGQGNEPPLAVADVRKRWRTVHVEEPADSSAALHTAIASLSAMIEAGDLSGVLSIPTRLDEVAEPREAVTVRLKIPRLAGPETSTILIRDAG